MNKNLDPIIELIKIISRNQEDVNRLKELDRLLDVLMKSCSGEEMRLAITQHKNEIKDILIEIKGG